MSEKIVYICAHSRSGSTLLDQLLGAHQDIVTVGEILHLNAYALNDRSQYDPAHELNCSCGLNIHDCGFWGEIAKHVDRTLDSFQLDPYTTTRNGTVSAAGLWRRFIARKLENRPEWYRHAIVRRLSGGSRLGSESFLLFDGIAAIAGTGIIVDSSKSIFRFLSLFYERPDRLRLILLVRDYRGVAYSRMQRGRTLERSVIGWSRKVQQMERLSALVPEQFVTRVRYEDLCAEPETVMRDLCRFIGVDFSPAVLRRQLPGLHHIGGSPSKFNEDQSEIRLDTRYQAAFTDEQLRRMRGLVGPEAEVWGYT